MIYGAYLSSLIATAVMAVVLAYHLWQRRSRPGARSAVFMMLAAIVISLTYLWQYSSSTLSAQVSATNMQYIGIMALPVTWVAFALQYTGHGKWLTRRNLLLLSIVPAVTVVVVWTNGIDGLMYQGRHLDTSGPFTIIAKTYGPWFWIASGYNYLLMLGAVFFLLRRLFQSPRLHRGQSIALLISIAVPLAWNVIYVADLTEMYHVDMTPSAFVISGAAIAWGLFRLRMFDVMPLAQDAVVQGMRDGVLVLDTEDRVVGLNGTAESIVGCTLQEAFGQPAGSALSRQPRLADLLHKTAIASESQMEVNVETDGVKRRFESRLAPLVVGHDRIVGRLIILHDITERLRAEQDLRQLYASERDMRQELEVEREKRTEFTRALVHELKTPITPVLAAAELLLQRIEDETSLKLVESIERSASNLNRRIDDLMDLIRGETEMLSLSLVPVDLVSLLENLGQEMTPVATDAGHSLVVDLPPSTPEIQADSDRLRQVVQNLLNNAIKFAPTGGTITLTARMDHARLIVEVHDTGHGMTEEDLTRLFDPYFRRVEDRERLGGLGLGLALSKRLVELHGGEMWVNSRKRQGTTFGFSLPLESTGGDEE